MKAGLAIAGLLGAAAASAHDRHMGFHDRRHLLSTAASAPETCGCTTYTTYFYGEPTLVPNPAPSTATVTPCSSSAIETPPPPPPSTYEAPPPPPSSAPEAPAYTPEPAPEPAPEPTPEPVPEPVYTPEPPKESYGGGHMNTNGDKWGITYTPYTQGGSCKSADEVAHDIADIKSKGFTTVRTYSTDCDGLPHISSACEANGVRMIIGIFIDNKGIGAAHEQVEDIKSWNKMNLVDMVVVGNEAIFNGYVSASQLAGLISEVKDTVRGMGYNGPVTTTETVGEWQNPEVAAALCGVVDVVGANVQPFFNPSITALGAGDFVAEQLSLLDNICPGKTSYNLECGWPNKGSRGNGLALPGFGEQKDAISSIMSKAGSKTIFFSYGDDAWKADGDFGIEKFYGLANLFG